MLKVKLYCISDEGSTGVHTQELAYRSFTFPAGERHIRFCGVDESVNRIKVLARINSSDELMTMLMAINALKEQFGEQIPIDLVLPYLPYARQDRVCYTGEAFGLKVMAELINGMNCNSVTVFDVHSPMAARLINNLTNIVHTVLIESDHQLKRLLTDKTVTPVAPDKGSQQRVLAMAQLFGIDQVVLGDKIRCPDTGHIQHVEFQGCVQGQHVLIIDDICDGGRTFIEVAKSLKAKGALSVSLYVTHGIFSQGLEVFEGLIDTVYTTDAFQDASSITEVHGINLKVIKVCEQFF